MVADSAPFGGSITFIYTSSWDASRRFYQDDLALTVLFDKGDVLFFALPGGRGSTLGLGEFSLKFSASGSYVSCIHSTFISY